MTESIPPLRSAQNFIGNQGCTEHAGSYAGVDEFPWNSNSVRFLMPFEEIGIEMAEAGGERGFRGLPAGGETLPDLIALAAEGVERHRDVR